MNSSQPISSVYSSSNQGTNELVQLNHDGEQIEPCINSEVYRQQSQHAVCQNGKSARSAPTSNRNAVNYEFNEQTRQNMSNKKSAQEDNSMAKWVRIFCAIFCAAVLVFIIVVLMM